MSEAPPSLETARAKEKRWLPVILSAGICPGIGQWAQKRRIIGMIYLTGFLAFFVFTMKAISEPFMQNIAYIRGEAHDPGTFSWASILGNFGACVLVYAINVFDVVWAEKRKRARAA